MHKIVHFDLKGAPLKVPYFEKILNCIKLWGGTGILLEWEDTFPYHSELFDIGSVRGSSGDGLYTRDEVKHIIEYAKMINLEVIQLIQTIGHMEYVLKHTKFASLRENPKNPSALCPSRVQSQELVRLMVDQVLEVQPDAKYLHIGADEVWVIGFCAECRERSFQTGTAPLYLEHIRNLALYIKLKRPELKILMWDDMMRPLNVDVLRPYNLGELVVPVLWHYYELKDFTLDPLLFHMYRQLFPSIWAASAFKGANGSSRLITPVSRYYGTHLAWVREFRNHPNVNFAGIVLTGWSRFDHYATLCELMPTALPSLANCLRVLNQPQDEVNVEDCTNVSEGLPKHEWPGMELAVTVDKTNVARGKCVQLLYGDNVQSWLNPWQLEHNYTNPVQVQSVGNMAVELLNYLLTLQNEIRPQLQRVTGPRSCEEWIQTNIAPLVAQLKDISETARKRSEAEPGIEPTTTLCRLTKNRLLP